MHKTRETQIYVVHQIWAMSMEKQLVLPFIRVGKENNREKLELMHTYVWGPSLASSFGIRALYSRVSLLQTGHRGIFTITIFLQRSRN